MDPFDRTPERPAWQHDAPPRDGGRPPYRPPIGIPLQRPTRWAGPLAVAFHTLVLLAILAPVLGSKVLPTIIQGAGGPGPAGGGGGGRQGSGGGEHVVERLRYIQTAPAPLPAPVPDPIVPPVPNPPVEEQKPEAPKIDVKIDPPTTTVDLALTAGIGGGTGNDGSNGSGPGSGGGVGSGVGTGRGSGEGPGTGGGPGTIFPPKPEFTLIVPFPIPNKVKGRTIVAHFSIDENGAVTKVELSPDSGDSGYNRRLRETFMEYKFRPATKWDGTPVAAVFPIQFTL